MANTAVQLSNESLIVPQKTEKLSLGTKISYGLGEFSGSVVWSLVSSYLLFFYTDVFGLAGGVAAILLFCKGMGHFCRSNTRLGNGTFKK
jgi:hypothetical protein